MTASTDTQAGALVGAPAIPKLDNGVEPFADTQAHGGGVEAVRSAQAFLERLIDLVSKAAYEYDERGNTDAFTHFGQQVAEWQFDGTFASYRDELAAALAPSTPAATRNGPPSEERTGPEIAVQRQPRRMTVAEKLTKAQERFVAALSADQRRVFAAFGGDNRVGRCGWPLSVWEAPGGAREALQPFMRAGLVKERRLGSYPGAELTPAGRLALEKTDDR